jgi:hypothetical protein
VCGASADAAPAATGDNMILNFAIPSRPLIANKPVFSVIIPVSQ